MLWLTKTITKVFHHSNIHQTTFLNREINNVFNKQIEFASEGVHYNGAAESDPRDARSRGRTENGTKDFVGGSDRTDNRSLDHCRLKDQRHSEERPF